MNILQQGYIRAVVYTSDARIPIEKAIFTVVKNNGFSQSLIGVRFTDKNGVTPYISVDAPDVYLSQSSGNEEPFSVVDIRVDHPEYKTYYVTGVQIFAGEASVQEAPLLPVDIYTSVDKRSERFDISKQNL